MSSRTPLGSTAGSSQVPAKVQGRKPSMPSDGAVVDPTLERAEPGTHSCLRVPLLKVALVMLTLVKCLFLWPYGKVMTDCQVVLTPASQRLLLRCPCNRRVPQCLRFVMMLLRLRIGQPGQPARHRLEPGEPSAPPIAPETNDEDMSADPEAKRGRVAKVGGV